MSSVFIPYVLVAAVAHCAPVGPWRVPVVEKIYHPLFNCELLNECSRESPLDFIPAGYVSSRNLNLSYLVLHICSAAICSYIRLGKRLVTSIFKLFTFRIDTILYDNLFSLDIQRASIHGIFVQISFQLVILIIYKCDSDKRLYTE